MQRCIISSLRWFLLAEVTLVLVLESTAFQVEYDANNWIKYEAGGVPFILLAPHGGNIKPSDVVDRDAGCYDSATDTCTWSHSCGAKNDAICGAKTVKDTNTMEITNMTANHIEMLTGGRPHVIYNLLHRVKLDANREVTEATFGVPSMVAAYNAFERFIADAKASFSTNPGLLLDIHGMTHVLSDGSEWTELGYSISKRTLNALTYKATYSTIESLG